MNNEITVSTLNEVCLKENKSIISGPFGSNISSKFFVETGIPVIRGNNLTIGKEMFIDSGFVYITPEKANELNCYAIKDDLIFTAAGTLGQVGMIPSKTKFNKYVISNKQIRARINRNLVLPEYAYYWFSSPWIQKKLCNNNKGSTVPLLTLSEIKSLPIKYPQNLKKQEKVVKILSSIDVQIKRNNDMVQKLQVLTQSIYSYWFNQFEFPNEEGKPYKSSGGEMAWNEELKREIPKDWEVKQLKELSTIILGGTPSRNIDEYWNNGNISWLNSGEIVNFPIITSSEKITLAGLENSATEYMKSGTVVVSITGNIRASILGIDSCANQSVVGIIENKTLRKEYLYPYISAILSKFIKMSTGNCQQHINKKTLEENQILIPKKSVILNYYNKVENMYSLIISTALQTNKLLQLKEKLLPLLINGQLI